jgi:hypothetical protein
MSETIEETKNNDFENNIKNNDNLGKYKYRNKEGKIIFVLEKKYRFNSEEYESIAWHFNKDFNLNSAKVFIKQYEESNINKYNNIMIDNQDKQDNDNDIDTGNNGGGKGSR